MNFYFLAAVFVILFISIAYYIYIVYHQHKFKGPKTGSTHPDVEIYFFYTDWCPHCKTAKPEWESVKDNLNDSVLNNYKLKFVDVNCTKESPEVDRLTRTYKIEGYPTIKLVKDSEIIEYDAKPERTTLTQFIQQTV
jgi:thiol-disulfide isomerase/thioredoxin